ncbi:MerR family transcriptional regulator [Cryobacterium sp. PH31-O1]|uniref:MerR family transcriptional regulator n=1 Tax=Cryobacterium sp. PH31-O1 TaxID=3046306 RepID=UPI0024BA3558|nr:MerR family transcriptional regulator [Cryobacterium sp. PH31-O1]MDJ0336655.1 MerR family transcriptional regulator [Cryobacterium sp. PH31-O1]
MAWSTSQLAELAGTTVKAVRHYHKVGLLEEPERRTNGYKQYQVSHLLRLLQISRLAELGVPLAEIASLGRADKDPDEAIRVLDAELAVTVDRLQRIRAELALILRHRSPAELPAGFSEVAGELSNADRSLVMIYSRVFDESAMEELRRSIKSEPRTAVDDELEALPPDSDRTTRQRLGELLAPAMARQLEQSSWLRDPGTKTLRGPVDAQTTVTTALKDLYNPAQLEVMYRAHLISTGATENLAALEAALDAEAPDASGLPNHSADDG